MAPPSGSAAYKKKDGTLTIAQDRQSISWIPAAGGAAGAITLPVAQITNLQQTPASNPKVMLKIFVLPPNAPASSPEQYVFSFTAGANARAEADAIRDALSAAIQAAKTAQSAPVKEGVSPAMAIANAVSSAGKEKNPWDDDKRLQGDVELQQSLLKSNPTLQRMFMESLHTKPDTLSASQFMTQFWSTRLHLLRAHAIERSQTRGSYNVLSTLKPRVEDSVTKLNISKEQIQLIFNQHPLVKRVYDENVPKLSEQQFWSRFFQSRLFKKLRGERISETDPTDVILDKYLKADESGNLPRDAHVPHFLDLAGNEVNNSQRQGNRPDLDMRPSSVEKVPIIRTLNSLSEKIMANVAPADGDADTKAGEDGTYNELQLRDLRGDEEQQRILLNVKDQSRFFSSHSKSSEDEQNKLFAQQDPNQILGQLRGDLEQNLPEGGAAPLGRLVEPQEDDDEDQQKFEDVIGSRANLKRASTQILEAIRDRRSQTEGSANAGTYGLSTALYDRLTLTHATTTEFLHQFWQAFLSGNADRAGEVASLVESLNRAMERIKSVAQDAEAERQVEVDRLKQHAREVLERTGRKLKLNLASVAGGEQAVNRLLGPTIRALETALAKYNQALAEEMKEVQSA
ncbi:RNA polymerase II transcription factor B subunit 1 [Aspergillus brasiliensis]|uniref:RNA polymerase II transcription factor B subunit 1 n=1 Tax=Aspergillus brasiliensis TaxID=319629 RepID=A0A9W5Z0F7_9EURO|nr:RNA polymerase II transcription factor B subunit 1 [Aspergillus brasiliensis]GKZ30941.1 RNA polymerase II transcription factor B subunit 1 [Aspergillus brasiliensis]GKZ43357.1 RNA polymerase II transcription factor B subunit 1 [Aspergillus brasiliensis]